ncbi:hypothetical protein Acr_14g0006230 [Actinidia rufa]|uniref:Uncharacterized protein n=1 Tax=Actinidia rufa TaxID=165716 RepID=A0A7J0FSR9_9ERIC|nr:hypothetical protein Acr_14g0006230 [Actinidia rufa]
MRAPNSIHEFCLRKESIELGASSEVHPKGGQRITCTAKFPLTAPCLEQDIYGMETSYQLSLRGMVGLVTYLLTRQLARRATFIAIEPPRVSILDFLSLISLAHYLTVAFVPASAGSLGRNVAAPLSLHHQPRNGHDLQPISPASCSSSMEVAPYTLAVTPTSSLDFRGCIGEHSSFSLKTSRELFKVLLNRNWSLEAQHASNMSLVDALKRELDHCRAEIKELAREKQTNHRAMTDLMNRFAEDKIARKKRDRELIKAAVQFLRNKLEDEKKLKKNSQSLHRKLSRELSGTKTSISNALKELEREKNARILTEDLCGEFAAGIRDYEQKVRFLKPQPEKDRTCKESPDRLILHLSEAWLDERQQMGLAEKNTVVDRLSLEIETFLRAKNCVGSVNSIFRRRSLASFRLNGAVSGPHNADDSNRGKQSNGIPKQNELVGTEIHLMGKIKPNRTKKKVGLRETIKCQTREAENKHVGNLGLNSNHVFNNSIRNHSSLLGGGKLRSEYNSKEESRASPMQLWISRFKIPDDEVWVPSCKWPHGLKVDTLKEKLLEARLEDQRSHSKVSKCCS